jgi:hypothetical protein
MAIQLITMHVEGVSDLLMHSPAGMVRVTAGPQRAGKNIPQPLDEARAGLYVSEDELDRLYVPADAVREAGLIAAKDYRDTTRKGRATMVQRFGASVFLSRMEFLLERQNGKPITSDDTEWTIYTKRAVVQRQGIMRSRARVKDWACNVEFEHDDFIAPEEIAGIVHSAGRFPGLLDYRPGKKGPFGRYQVMTVNGLPYEGITLVST